MQFHIVMHILHYRIFRVFNPSAKSHKHIKLTLYSRIYCDTWSRCLSSNSRACECILKPTSANIHQYQFNNSFIIKLRHFSVNFHEFSDKLISYSYIEWWYCILRQSVQYRQLQLSPVQYATSYVRRFCGKVRKIIVNLIKVC